MAKKVKLSFFFEIESEFKKLIVKAPLNAHVNDIGPIISKDIAIPPEYILLKPSSKARPIGLLQELDLTISELVDEHGTSFNVYNLLKEKIELDFTTKTVNKNRWNTVFQKVDRDQTFRDLLPDLVEWSGYPVTDMRFITSTDDNKIELLKEDFDLKIPELVAKYRSNFELESISWNGW